MLLPLEVCLKIPSFSPSRSYTHLPSLGQAAWAAQVGWSEKLCQAEKREGGKGQTDDLEGKNIPKFCLSGVLLIPGPW